MTSAKDGCSPQGQCGCCTVLVDGSARVACVLPVRRVAGRSVTTLEGLDPSVADRLVGSFAAHGASQCGFCTPGILCRVAALGPQPPSAQVETALLAHLCRCTGWRTILEAVAQGTEEKPPPDPAKASLRATIEGGVDQQVGPAVVRGGGGFADDEAPKDSLVAVPDPHGGWAIGETLAEARQAAAKVQGRRSGGRLGYPIEVPGGDWDFTLQTTWVEPGYLEPDSSWCLPGADPASPVRNGGAFGGKLASPAPAAARELADRFQRPVRVVLSREDVVRIGPKRPPLAAGVNADGTGNVVVAEAPGIAEAIAAAAPGVAIETVHIPRPPVSSAIRAAGWAEGAVLVAAAGALESGRVPPAGTAGEATVRVQAPNGAEAEATVRVDAEGRPSRVDIRVCCGDPLDEVTSRSYVVGAAHMGLGWVCTEGIAVGDDGHPTDLTIRSFGILRARDTPPINVTIDNKPTEPVRGSDAAFAAVAAATWVAQGLPPRWPSIRGRFR